ncbi:hypothetical protein GKE82_23485 [Conexibacter sp. W3-3-2]|uniref:hypothetical protein n=1 Tax=Conexibacter sp. W3-3-2 TaxID=2675227 RepID=UPI0012B84CCE|nr:hypothetical protein [Conexibacter sp. W3-3-2]MTD47168.1 hypothetical protein [Conexibacter sp. W3-3-2]
MTTPITTLADLLPIAEAVRRTSDLITAHAKELLGVQATDALAASGLTQVLIGCRTSRYDDEGPESTSVLGYTTTDGRHHYDREDPEASIGLPPGPIAELIGQYLAVFETFVDEDTDGDDTQVLILPGTVLSGWWDWRDSAAAPEEILTDGLIPDIRSEPVHAGERAPATAARRTEGPVTLQLLGSEQSRTLVTTVNCAVSATNHAAVTQQVRDARVRAMEEWDLQPVPALTPQVLAPLTQLSGRA